jgi:hypothetical protein
MGPMGPAGFRRRGRRRGLIVGAAVGSAAARRNANNDQQQDAVQPQGAGDEMAELEKMAELHKQGVLTDEEFQAKKKQILGL